MADGPDYVVLAQRGSLHGSSQPDLLVLGTLYGGTASHRASNAVDRLRALVAVNWGAYMAFAADGNGARYAMVDPSGAGRAHLAADQHLTMVTDLLDPPIMRGAGFEISADLPGLAGCLLDPGTMVTAPLLHGVTPMVPGTAYPLRHDESAVALWSPTTISGDENADGRDLRRSVDTSIHAMTAGGGTLIELSGGLDSSIIAGTMTELGMPARAATVELIGGDVDEIRYARATAERCGMPLHRGEVTTFPDYAAFMEAPQVGHPYMYGLDDAFARVIVDALADDVDRIVTGQGGDAVLFQPATPLTTIDRVRSRGVRSGWRELLDDARRTRASIWHHILPAITDFIHPAGMPQDELAAGLLTRGAREGRTRFLHPWCADARQLPPGRRLQVLMLANSLVFHSGRALDLGRPLIHPLLSQPVVESALAIPTWRLATGRLDRGLARSIFADRLHPAVARRRSKGEAAAFYSRAATANLPYLRERLLDGALARAGIIDNAAMEKALTPEYLFHSLDYRALILHAACEAWLSAWAA